MLLVVVVLEPSPRKVLSGCPELENAVRIAIRIDLRDLGWRQDAVRTYSPKGPLPMKCCSYVRWHHGSSIPAASLSSKPRLARKYSLVTAMPLQAHFFSGEGALAQLR